MITLRPHQVQLLARVDAAFQSGARRVVMQSPTGCHRAGQLLLAFDGSLVRVENVAVGDLLMGPDSQPREVLSLCRGEGHMVRITPVKGPSFVVNDEHVLTLVRTG